jgi:hypothetical protein
MALSRQYSKHHEIHRSQGLFPRLPFARCTFHGNLGLRAKLAAAPVKFFLSLGPGSGADIGARLYSDPPHQAVGQPVVVENVPAATASSPSTPSSRRRTITRCCGADGELRRPPVQPGEHVLRPEGARARRARLRHGVTLGVPASMNVGSLKELLETAKQKKGWLNWTTA